MTALRYHQGNVLHDQVVGSATEHMHILRRPKIGYVQIGTCCCKAFDIVGSYRVEDPLKQIALPLPARAAGPEYARTLCLCGPGACHEFACKDLDQLGTSSSGPT